ERFQTAGEVAAQLVALAGGAAAPGRRFEINRRRILVGAAAGLSLAGLGFLVFRRGTSDPLPNESEAAQILKRVLPYMDHPRYEKEIRQELFDLRLRFPGTPEAVRAGGL